MDGGAAVATRRKLEWLRTQLDAERPAVLFLLEISGTKAHMKELKTWFQRLGYKAEMQAYQHQKNAIVVAIDLERGRLTATERVAGRVMGAVVRSSVDGGTRRFACIHGLSGESTKREIAEGRLCFAQQVARMEDWIGGGGLMGGDWNRVPLRAWRVAAEPLSADDRRVSRLCGLEGAQAPGPAATSLVGGTGAGASTEWTRWHTSGAWYSQPGWARRCMRSRFREPTARIDYAIAIGSEGGAWRERLVLQPTDEDELGRGWALSDHAYCVYERPAATKVKLGDRRPLPLPVGGAKGDADVRALYLAKTQEEAGFAASMEEAAEITLAAKGSRMRGTVDALVAPGEESVREVAARRAAAASVAVRQGAAETPKDRYQQWMARLQEALRRRAEGVEPRLAKGGALEGCSMVQHMAERTGSGREAWARIITRCRREVRAARAAWLAERKAEDAKLVEMAKDVTKEQVDAAIRMQKVWRALRERRGSAAIESVWEGDEPPADEVSGGAARIDATNDEFLPELGRIGQKFVRSLADTPACPDAFRAWCDIFLENFEELEGTRGGKFKLADELTWDVFQEVLACMPGGKAVGAGGFSAELLRAAGEPAQRAFYKALISDLREKRVPEEWRTVLYALLVKPAPSNPDVVAERREIALMAHEMKLLLQMVRRVAYQRLIGRVMNAQAGWLGGYGTTDPALIVAGVIQQSARHKQPLWLLYIDLATFFGRVDREVLTVAELLHGLPPEVVELTARIYGTAVRPEEAVTCHYDSAAGLGDGFKNWMGALMGCVLSPDRCKLLLNSVIVAIDAICKGVRLWGHGDEGDVDTWRRIAQVAFADDWCGSYSTVGELRKAWSIWRAWEAISGSKLGVKKKLKTVVTGVQYVNGVATCPEDPLLKMRDGSYMPFARHDECYKHLGKLRRADGSDEDAWSHPTMGLRHKLLAAVARLRRMRRPSINDFMLVSNALIGGLAGYYLQTIYITFEQAEEVESKWRAVYRMHFGRGFEEAHSKPRAYFYAARGRGLIQREHLWATGLTALVTCVSNAMADIGETPQRAVARSMVAEALVAWGCRADPQEWDWRHLSEALELSLRRSKSKHLGEAWMLAMTMIEQEHVRWWEEVQPDASKWASDFGSTKRALWGRWAAEAPAGDALHAGARHFDRPQSVLITEPTTRGGLGLEPEPMLLRARVAAVGHMCCWEVAADGAREAVWMHFERAMRQHPMLPRHGAARAAWTRQLERLSSAGIPPCEPEVTEAFADGGGRDAAVDHDQIAHLLGALHEPDVRARRSQASWRRQLERCFPSASRRRAGEWRHGGRDRQREARGARYAYVVDKERSVCVQGGEARWLARQGVGYSPPAGDETGLVMGDDGWLLGHAVERERLLARMDIDDEGFAIDDEGRRYEGAALAELPPALQLQARARLALQSRKPTAEVIDEWPAPKEKKTHVNLAVARRNREELAHWQAAIGATAAFTLDATRKKTKNKEYVVARAAVRHDGATLGGRLNEPEGNDNYIGELAAHIDAAESLDVGARVILVFDATSPVLAMRKLRQASHRKRQGKYVGEWLDALLRLLDRCEVVVFLWQTSHVGSTVNEWADLCADDLAEEAAEVDVRRLPSRSATMQLSMPQRSVREWAAPRARRAIQWRLQAATSESQFHEWMDVPVLTLPEAVQQTCEAVLAQRACMGDAKRRMGRVRLARLGQGLCPFGCIDTKGETPAFTWLHAQFWCRHEPIMAARAEWCTMCADVSLALRPGGTQVPHSQAETVVKLAEGGLPRTRGGAPPPQRPLQASSEVLVRRFVGGLVRSTGDSHLDKSTELRKRLMAVVAAGAAVQHAAQAATKEMEEAALAEAVAVARVRKYAQHWRRVTVEGGPARAAALRAVMAAEARAIGVIERRVQSGATRPEAAGAQIERMVAASDKGRSTAGALVTAELAGVRAAYRRQGGGAYQQWRHLQLLTRWRLRAALKQRPWHGLEDPMTEDGELVVVPTVVAAWSDRRAGGLLREATSVAERVMVGVAQVREPADGWVEGLIAKEARLARAWDAGGRRRGEAKRRSLRLGQRRAWAAFENYTRWGFYCAAGARCGLSGQRLASVGEHISLVIGKRRRGGQTDDRRTASRRAFLAGEQADRFGRWPVDRVMEVRKRRCGRWWHLEIRLRWRGLDPVTQLPWPDEWVTRTDDEGRQVLNAALSREAAEMERQMYGTRAARAAEELPPRRVPHCAQVSRKTRRIRPDDDDGEAGQGQAAPAPQERVETGGPSSRTRQAKRQADEECEEARAARARRRVVIDDDSDEG